MGTKENPGKFDCYENAFDDEPMFVLLARDPYAPFLVRQWANQRRDDIEQGARPVDDYDMTKEAYVCAYAMEKWRSENWPRRKEEQKQKKILENLRLRVAALADGAEIIFNAQELAIIYNALSPHKPTGAK